MIQVKKIFSGEPLPVAPLVGSPEVDAFNRKLLDYLRRLTGKLDGLSLPPPGGGSGNIPTYVGYFTEDQSLEASYAPIDWTTDLWIDDAYAHDTINPERIQVLSDGLYACFVDIEIAKSGFYPVDVKIVIYHDDGSTTFSPLFGHGLAGTDTFSMAVTLPLTANKAIAFFIQAPFFPDPTGIKFEGTRLTILKLADNADGGTGEGGIGWDSLPDNPPSWGVAIS